MNDVVVAKTFFDSASRLGSSDRTRVFDFLRRFHANPANPGTSLERVTKARDQGVWSARITRGLRAIVHKDAGRVILLYAGQHEDAYDWARRRSVRTHPQTGVLQIVETSEEMEHRLSRAPASPDQTPLIPQGQYDDRYLLSLGLPEDWLPTIRLVRTEDQLLDVGTKLPEEVAERLLSLVAGELVTPPAASEGSLPLAENPDNLRRFFVVQSDADLAEVLNQPIEAWLRFLHPSQRSLANGSFSGPTKVTGSAGTGKTVVALHRTRALARNGKHVLLTSFVTTLCHNLERNLRVLCRPEERGRITVDTVHRQALKVARTSKPGVRAVSADEVQRLLQRSCQHLEIEAEGAFLRSEWAEVIDRQGITTWEAYRDADRRGRGRPLSVRDRERLWQIFSSAWSELDLNNHTTWSGLCRLAADQLDRGAVPSPFDAVIVDEVQDLSPAAIRFVAGLRGTSRDGLFLVGDAGQRIYPGGFSLRALGIDVRGRSKVLRLNYRTTEQIQRVADRILGDTSDDLDGGAESRSGTTSLLRGPDPVLSGFRTAEDEHAFAVRTVRRLISEGLSPGEIALFARTKRTVEEFGEALRGAEVPVQPLSEERDDDQEALSPGVVAGTMHRAKGLEFKAVLVVGCDERRLPNAFVLERVAAPEERDAVIEQERRLLYVSLTRARDEAFVTWHGEPSPFLDAIRHEARR